MNKEDLKFSFIVKGENIVYSYKRILNFYSIIERCFKEDIDVIQKYEIHIQGPSEKVDFLFDSTLQSYWDSGKNALVLSQYDVEFFQIFPNNNDINNVYSINLTKLNSNSCQNPKLVVNLDDISLDSFYIQFSSIKGPNEVIYDPPSYVSRELFKRKLSARTSPDNISYYDFSSQEWMKIGFRHVNDAEPLEIVNSEDGSILPLKSFMLFKDESKTEVTKTYTDEDRSVVAQSFTAKLTYTGKVQNNLITEYVCRCAEIYSKGTTYAPYAVLCQSSGFGKSRGICEVGRRLSSIYGVFRKDKDTGYPNHSNWLDRIVTFINEAVEIDLPVKIPEGKLSDYKVGRALIYFSCLLEAFTDWFKSLIVKKLSDKCFPASNSPDLILSDQEVEKICDKFNEIMQYFELQAPNLEGFQNMIQIKLNSALVDKQSLDQICASIIHCSKQFEYINKQVYKRKNELDKVEWAGFIKEHFGTAENSAHRIWPKENQDAYPFLVILDEASVLAESEKKQISTLTIIRRALHYIPSTKSFLVVTLGTNCDVSTLNKPVTDNSLRYTERLNLLYPMIVTGNWDIHAKESKLHELVVDGQFLQNKRTLLLKCSFGRPIWNSLSVNYMISTGVTKLKNGSTDLYTPSIAAWCIRVGLTVNAEPKLSEKLLRSHMATLVSASSKADQIIVSYSAEPVLAIAARELIGPYLEKYFESLLHFVEGVPTDRGKIGESVFSEILLQAMDKSAKIATISDLEPAGASDRVKEILRTKKFILESRVNQDEKGLAAKVGELSITGPVDKKAKIEESQFSDDFCQNFFRVTNVKNFLESLYRDAENMFDSFLPAVLLKGLLNFGQFVPTHRDFPYEKFFGQSYEELNDASRDYAKKCNIFDKAMKKMGLLKDIAYGAPFGYYGLDAIIPVLLEENGRFVYSYIGLQFKVGTADKIETLTKTDPFLHLNAAEYEEWEIQVIRKNHLVLVLSAESDIEKSKLSVSQEKSVNGPFAVSMYPRTSTTLDDNYSLLKESFYKLPEKETLKLDSVKQIVNPPFPRNVPAPVSFAKVKIAPHLSICGISWGPGVKHTCIWSSSLLAFKSLLGIKVVNLAHEIMRSDRSIFKGNIDDFAFKFAADVVLNTQSASYPNSDPMLREFRGQSVLPPVITDFSHWKTDLAVDNKVDKKLDEP